jgi:2',3'-cyclic-nucleotide 2'-phosphodiesterase (5'-nucleotidase family)
VKLAPRLLFAICIAACAPATLPGGSNQGTASGPASFELVVLSTTDVHGRIRGWDYYTDSAEPVRGLTRAATIVDSVRAANPGRVVLVDAGDLLQGNPFAYIAMKEFSNSSNPIIAAMNAMRYDAAAIGNHEYNYGVPYLERAVAQARFPMLSANTWKPDGTHKFRPWTIIERQGVKIGIVGATTPGVMVWDAENVRGRVRLTDIVPAVRTAVDEVRGAGASVVIVSVHSGLNEPASYDTVATGLPGENVAERVALQVPGIDLIVYGHSHKEQKDLHIGPTLLMQPKNWATSVGVAHLTLVREGGVWKVTSSRGETIPSAGRLEQRALLALSAPAHRATVAYANETIGTTPVAWRGDSARLKDTPLIDFINEVEKKAASADLALSPAFTLDASLAAGPVTVARIAQLYPYDNTLRAVRISGKDLRDYLEFSSRYYKSVENGRPVIDPEVPGYNFDIVSGADYSIDLSRPIGSRVTKLVFNGKPVAPADSLTLALHDYRQSGGGGYTMLKGAPVVYDQQQEIRQLLIDEVRARNTLKPEDYFKPNWSLTFGGPAGSQGAGGAELPAGALRLRIIATNDFHGALEPRADANGVLRGGAAYVAAMIEKAKSECAPSCETLVLDGGDQFQGTPISNLAYGRPVVDFYNRIGLAAAALGNHEFDWGVDTLRARMRDAHYAILGANVKLTDGGDVSWIRDDTIIVRGRTKIGIVGISTPTTPTETLAANVRGLKFLQPPAVIDAHARSLRARGADIVIVVAHEGGFCNSTAGAETCNGDIFDDAAKITENVDLIVSGHTHSQVNTTVKNIPIVQARSSGQAIDVVDIPLDVDGKPTGSAFAQIRSVTTASIEPHAAVDSMVRIAAARVAPIVNRRVATIRTPLRREGDQYSLGNLVTDAQRWAGKGDIAVMNNGGIRADLPAGEITYGKLFVIQPFANTLYRIRMTGAQVREYFEKVLGGDDIRAHVSGITIGYNPEKPRGERIVSLRLPAGRTLADNAFYDVVMNNFMATGGSNMGPPEGSSATPLNIVDLDALIDYLRMLKSPIVAPTDSRIFIAQ